MHWHLMVHAGVMMMVEVVVAGVGFFGRDIGQGWEFVDGLQERNLPTRPNTFTIFSGMCVRCDV